MSTELNSVVWQNIDRLLLSKGIPKVDFKRIVRRNKNTYTKWFKEPRPILKISDLDEIATALEIAPGELLKAGMSNPPMTPQLELPFEPNSTTVYVQVDTVTGGISLRPMSPLPNTAAVQLNAPTEEPGQEPLGYA